MALRVPQMSQAVTTLTCMASRQQHVCCCCLAAAGVPSLGFFLRQALAGGSRASAETAAQAYLRATLPVRETCNVRAAGCSGCALRAQVWCLPRHVLLMV